MTSLVILAFGVTAAGVSAAQPSAALLKAKQEAEAKGYIFETSHDEIVAKARKEGRVKSLSSLEPDVYPHMIDSFKKKYPFMQIEMVEIQGPDSAQRFVMEMKAGTVREWDLSNASTDFYPQYVPYSKKFDILGMAEHGVLKISPKMVDPKLRNFVSLTTGISVPVYNKKLTSETKVPDRWEGFLAPEFKGRKFLVDIRPHVFAAFPACPEVGMGFEWTMKFAKGLRSQEPVWFRGNSRGIGAVQSGEYALHFAVHYQSAVRAMQKDPTGSLQLKIIEPVPVRFSSFEVILKSSANPYAALLLLEHEASPEGQDLIDKYYPQVASVYSPGSHLSKLLKGKKLCVNGFDTFHNSHEWMAKAVEAFGFPKAEKR
jgi:ABC-type Fe3+ transport system substrate-binding protein